MQGVVVQQDDFQVGTACHKPSYQKSHRNCIYDLSISEKPAS
jgi:hypothetical protein